MTPAEKRALAMSRLSGQITTDSQSRPASQLVGREFAGRATANKSPFVPASYRPITPQIRSQNPTWAYGVTTVPSRRDELLPRTLKSLSAAGFDRPRLFVDGCNDPAVYRELELPTTIRPEPNVRTVGNWVLSMWELYIRNPSSDFYALFQDDFVTYKNLRQYLERCPYPSRGYCNLYTFPANQSLEQDVSRAGWFKSNQRGYGAVGLVFSREAVCVLLQSQKLVARPQDPSKGWRFIDMCIAGSMNAAGYNEFVHNPSLMQHTGRYSSMGNSKHPLANSFRGEDFDALSLLGDAAAHG